MSAIVPALAVAFAALYVWLIVRVVNRRERWAKYGVIAVGVPLLYVASFGPVCWIHSRIDVGGEAIWVVYRPLFGILQSHGPRFIQDGLRWFAELGAPADHYLATWDSSFFWRIGPIFD